MKDAGDRTEIMFQLCGLKTQSMKQKSILKAALLCLLLVVCFVASWELYWRSKGYTPTFNDDKALWAVKRARAYRPSDEATVFIGSSRIKFDLDIPTWESTTGEEVVQLSLVGTSPLLLLKDLADDEKFKGKLVIDVTEPLFFSKNPFFHKSAMEAIHFYKKRTPSEQLSTFIDFGLESGLTFLEEKRFSLNTLLNDLEIPNRPGVFVLPAFPKSFEWNTYDRQTYMSDLFLTDTAAINRQTGIWLKLIMSDKTPPISGGPLVAIFNELKPAVEKIRSRGGKVIFTRTPSSGLMGEGEKKVFPREKYWNGILSYTNSEGIHFSDYAETKGLICPEWSHLSPKQAVVYTQCLIKALDEKGWFGNRLSQR